jgi:hypothetical protein
MLKELGLDVDDPIVQREWFCRWVADTERPIYTYDFELNSYYRLPDLEDGQRWYRVLSIDMGHRDMCSFTVTYSRRGKPDIYVVRSEGEPGMLTTAIAAKVRRLVEKYGDPKRGFDQIVIDPGGGGAKLVDDLGGDYGISAKAAQKPEKLAGIRMVQSMLKCGTLHVHPYDGAQLLGEWTSLVWDKHRVDHHKNCDDDCSDGLIYGVREHDTREDWEREAPEFASDEFWREEAKRMRKARSSASNKRNNLRGAMRR